jgi:hypothetical protein
MHLFEATELTEVPGGGLACDADEELAIRWASPEELLRLEPQDAKTLVAALACLQGGGPQAPPDGASAAT